VSKQIRKKGSPAIQKFIEENRLSQKAFGEMVGASQGLVWQWLNGETSITPEKAKDIEAKTGIPRMALLYPKEKRAA
jgi:transcriptional regulator with XRE-family HTH domain